MYYYTIIVLYIMNNEQVDFLAIRGFKKKNCFASMKSTRKNVTLICHLLQPKLPLYTSKADPTIMVCEETHLTMMISC